MWDRYFEDNDTDNEDDSDNDSLLKRGMDEKQLPQNQLPLTLRKHREYKPWDEQQEFHAKAKIDFADKEFEWYSPERHDSESYFAMINTNRRTLEPGEQCYYCYGHRSNKFLLTNYGFCFENNKYDSFEVHLNL